jgi:hypothetical protein
MHIHLNSVGRSALIALALTVLASGCTSLGNTLVGEEHENVAPFAEQTIASLSIERLDVRRDEFVYLRFFVDFDAPELVRLRESLERIDDVRDQIVYYSVGLVRIAEQDTSDEKQIEMLVDRLNRTGGARFFDKLAIEQDFIDAIIQDMRAEDTLMGALQAMQPIIDRTGEYTEQLLKEIEEVIIVEARQYMDTRIQEQYAAVIDFLPTIDARRDEVLNGLALLRKSRLGDAAAYQELRDSSIVLERSLVEAATPTEKQLGKIEKYLMDEMETVADWSEFVIVDGNAYIATQAEVDREMRETIDGLGLVRVQVLAWSRAHLAMAQGVRDAAGWLKVAVDAASAVRAAKRVD